ncbi:2-hydroxyacid dehydrogenase [Desulforamulus aeronauticus]|uniref:Glyoxylate reductase n=1 Tax=Desulforamulus aeronauticus DSM 10349 TaxID=1121421 RepID=A0A1M6PZZ1_9FIRM|nr:D-glycerate dehydrogenase [Desulforamulus aeronauticus]SHK13426.1 glyoxylate reductase [Desulforamulus aeronauticus DSM 10349]
MKPRVYITRTIPQETLTRIKEVCDVKIWDEEDVPVPYEVLEKEITEVEGLYSLLTDKIDQALLEKAKNLKVISNMAVGFNNIDLAAASQKGMMVTNTPGVLTETTADFTFALLLATARRMIEAANFLRQGKWKTWSPMLLTGQDIYEATLGIIGMGRIGEGVVKRAKGFDMRVLYYNRTRKPEAEEKFGAEYVAMDTLLRESDFVCVMTPYTPETTNLIGARELSLMKKTAILINTARGGIVNEEALYHALKQGELWAAGLDVFENEPVALDHPLLTLPNVVALPHIGSASEKTRTTMANLAAENLLTALAGKTPPNLVNRDVLER